MSRAVRWTSGRAVALHLSLILVLPMCVIAAWWQVHRALSGNFLSWLYVFEWPAFAGIGVWLWWVLLTTRGPAAATVQSSPPAPRDAVLARRAAPLRWDSEKESGELRAYNSFLADLNAGKPMTRPKRAIPWRQLRLRMWKAEVQGR